MSEDYEQFAARMEERFPKMFKDQPYGGFACGEGWWKIIEELCGQIQHHADHKNRQFNEFNRGQGCPQVVVRQIKEKFGGLRFYYDGGDDVVDGMVRMAESWAGASCETCSAPGTRRSGGWIRTLCDVHEAERQIKINNLENNS
jgi:hypothetical protein